MKIYRQYQAYFVSRDKVISTSSNRIFDCVVPNGTTYIECNYSNVIYAITCNRCSLQCVGETLQKLNYMFNWHKTVISQRGKYGFCCIALDLLYKGAVVIRLIQFRY